MKKWNNDAFGDLRLMEVGLCNRLKELFPISCMTSLCSVFFVDVCFTTDLK